MKKIIWAIVLIVVVGLVIWFLQSRQSSKTADTANNTKQQTQQTKDFDPKNPNFVTGKITSADASQIVIAVGSDNYTAKISSSTTLVKQTKDAKGLTSVVTAQLSDLKPGVMVVAYFDNAPVNKVYQATKIQIISSQP